jgi:DNA-binding transcriptional ArsR family regulator
MKARRAHRRRPATQVEVLDALVDRGQEGMTVLELRAAVDADIDAIEEALPALKDDGLISVDTDDGTTTILPDDQVMPRPDEEPARPGLLEQLRARLGL